VSQARIGEIERRMSNIVRPGTVLEADYANARVKVQCGGNQTAWIPWVTSRAGADRTWHAPEVGEQVLVLAPSGDLAQGYVLPGGVYKNDYPANADSAEISRTNYKDGATIEYDREAHTYNVHIPHDGKATIKVNNKAALEVHGHKILAKVGNHSLTEMTETKITHEFGNHGKIELDSNGVKITVGATVLNITTSGTSITGNLTVSGNITTSTGEVTAGTIALKTHKHLGVQTGSGTSGLPTP
jgi:phage baseplate assembly protein V